MSNLTDPLPPHAAFDELYADAGGKRAFLRGVFDATATDYDRVENVLALGSGRWYRRQALRRAGVAAGMRVLDVAAGTGLVAREAASLVGGEGRVVGIDPSAGMLRELRRAGGGVSVAMGVAEALPVADGAFDAVTMGYALRHVADLRPAFSAFHRALGPGGRVCILEITRPSNRLAAAAMRGYFRAVLPLLGRAAGAGGRTRELWRYYGDTIERCVPPETVLGALAEAGFQDVARGVSLGIFSEFTGRRGA